MSYTCTRAAFPDLRGDNRTIQLYQNLNHANIHLVLILPLQVTTELHKNPVPHHPQYQKRMAITAARVLTTPLPLEGISLQRPTHHQLPLDTMQQRHLVPRLRLRRVRPSPRHIRDCIQICPMQATSMKRKWEEDGCKDLTREVNLFGAEYWTVYFYMRGWSDLHTAIYRVYIFYMPYLWASGQHKKHE